MLWKLYLSRHCQTDKTNVPLDYKSISKNIPTLFNNNFNLPPTKEWIQNTILVWKENFLDKQIVACYSWENLVSQKTAGLTSWLIKWNRMWPYTAKHSLNSPIYNFYGCIDILWWKDSVLEIVTKAIKENNQPYKAVRWELAPHWEANDSRIGTTFKQSVEIAESFLQEIEWILKTWNSVFAATSVRQSKVIQLLVGSDWNPDVTKYSEMKSLWDNEFIELHY